MHNALEERAPAHMVGGRRVKAPTHNVPLKTAEAVEEDKTSEGEEERQISKDTKFEEFERMRRAEASQKMAQDQQFTIPKHEFSNKNVGGSRTHYNQPRLHNHMVYRDSSNA
ncbi:hypothetical protein Unana1_00036 [Umbelopsis nana]